MLKYLIGVSCYVLFIYKQSVTLVLNLDIALEREVDGDLMLHDMGQVCTLVILNLYLWHPYIV